MDEHAGPPLDASKFWLRELRDRLRLWARTRLWAQVLAALVLGVVVGAILGPDLGVVDPSTGAILGAWMAIPGRVFLSLISLVLVPLVLASIVRGIAGAPSGRVLRRVGGRLLVFVLVTTVAASLIGVGIASTLRPGDLLREQVAAMGEATEETGKEVEPPIVDLVESDDELGRNVLEALPDVIVGLVPTSLTSALVDRDMFEIVVIALLLGIACATASRERITPVFALLDGLLAMSMTVVKWAMLLAPLAVFGLMAQLVIQVGLGTIASLAAYAGAVLLGLLLVDLVYLAMIQGLTRHSALAFLRATGPTQLMAFSTSSTAAVMPLSIETAVTKLGVRDETANLVIPLAATVNMAGTALYQSIAILFLAQAAGVELPLAATIGVVVAVVAASIGAPGTPGVGIVILTEIAAGAGIPSVGLPLVLGLDRPLDMARTAVNVTGDLTACVVVDGDGAGPD